MDNPTKPIDLYDPEFRNFVRKLHEQFMRGEISQGKMAELLGMNRVDLIHLLETLNLQVTNL